MKSKKKKIFKKPVNTLTTKHLLNKPKFAKNTPEYYLCMGTCCKGKNITQVARDCKNNAPALVAKRTKKIQELVKASRVIGKFAQDLEKVLKN